MRAIKLILLGAALALAGCQTAPTPQVTGTIRTPPVPYSTPGQK